MFVFYYGTALCLIAQYPQQTFTIAGFYFTLMALRSH